MGTPCIIVDMDGTLAKIEHRVHFLEQEPKDWQSFHDNMVFDDLNEAVATTVIKLASDNPQSGSEGLPIVIVSARHEDYREHTTRWLDMHGIPYVAIYMRKNNDFRVDVVVKEEILDQIIHAGYEPILAIDDSPAIVEMWRSYGITSFQCAPDEERAAHVGKTLLTMMVGPSGAGKSTWIETTMQRQKVGNMPAKKVVCPDQIRLEYGWGHSPDDLRKTWGLTHDLIRAYLRNGLPVVLDATNIKKKDRDAVHRCVPRGQCVDYVVLNRSLDEKLEMRGWRPEDLIMKHHKTFESQLKDILAGDYRGNVIVHDRRLKR